MFLSVGAASVASYFGLARWGNSSDTLSNLAGYDRELFLGKRKTEYLEEINTLPDGKISEFLEDVLLSEEYKNRVFDDVRMTKHIGSGRYYISNKRISNIKREELIRKVMESYSYISEVQFTEISDIDRNKKLEKQFEIQIFSQEKNEIIGIIEKIIKSGGYINEKLRYAEYCFAMTWSGERREKISNSLVFLIHKRDWDKYKSCVFEELLHAFGFNGDSNVVNNSIMSHNNFVVSLHGADLFALRALYNQKVTPGMSRSGFKKIEKQVIAETREWFERCFIESSDCNIH